MTEMEGLAEIKKRLTAIELRLTAMEALLQQLPVYSKKAEIRIGGNEAEIFKEALKDFRKAIGDRPEDNKA